MIENLIYITMLVLLPIIPAYILYKTLPSRAIVSGPFKGLNIQLSGAFGGYFVVLLVMLSFFYTCLKPLTTQYEIWTITGNIAYKPVATSPNVRSTVVFIRPPQPVINEDGSFDIKIPVKREPTGVRKLFGTLIVDYEGYEVQNVDLNEKEAPFVKQWDKEYNKKTKEIRINEPILLRRGEGPAYSPTGEEPQRTNLPTEVNP